MQIIDKYGYLEDVLDFVEKKIIYGKSLQKLAEKAKVDVRLIESLSKQLKGFSEKYFLTTLAEELENRHSSLSGAVAEISAADAGIEVDRNKVFVSLALNCDIVVGEEREDKAKVHIKIFSKSNMQIHI